MPVIHKLVLPSAYSGLHLISHVLMLRHYILDESHVHQYDLVELDDRLTFVEELATMFTRVVVF